jgi:formamidopyrimidine-DNA glycosylase
MIELPEAVAMARQLSKELTGKRIASATAGNSPHKWVWYKPSREELQAKLPGRTVSGATAVGRGIHLQFKQGLALVVDDFGGRILFHQAGQRLPRRHQLFLEFNDESFLTVAIQGWGFIKVEPRDAPGIAPGAVSPVERAFTVARLGKLMDGCERREKDSIKTFFINGKSIAGIGNGYLQDILFRARIHPTRKVSDIAPDERKALHRAVKETVKEAIAQGGRATEKDIYGNPGRYQPAMDRYAKGKPCRACGTTIEAMKYLGGTCYVCPTCQT